MARKRQPSAVRRIPPPKEPEPPKPVSKLDAERKKRIEKEKQGKETVKPPDTELVLDKDMVIRNAPPKKNYESQYKCSCCGIEKPVDDFYKAIDSNFYKHGVITICRECCDTLFEFYTLKYKELEYENPQQKAVERLCLATDIMYSETMYESARKNFAKKRTTDKTGFWSSYYIMTNFKQWCNNYDYTINKRDSHNPNLPNADVILYNEIPKEIYDRWGEGLYEDDYRFLQREYDDWTSRHTCETKSQEENFKRICFIQLQIHKNAVNGVIDTQLEKSLQDAMNTGGLQPKQSAGKNSLDNESFGSLIAKFETERPIPNPEPEFRDVDKIGTYIDVFFKGHLAKAFNLKNGLSKIYDKFMEPFTARRVNEDYTEEEIFYNIFGNDDEEDYARNVNEEVAIASFDDLAGDYDA